MIRLLTIVLCLLTLAAGGCGERLSQEEQVSRELHRALRATSQQDFDRAFAFLDEAEAIDAGNWRVHFVRGNILMMRDRHGEALLAFDRAIRLDADVAEAPLFKGMCLAQLGRAGEADDYYRRALTLYQQRIDTASGNITLNQITDSRIHIALITALRGDQQQALQLLDEALAADPGYPAAEYYRHAIREG